MEKPNQWRNIIQDCLFPPTCLLCGHGNENSKDICPFCHANLPWNLCCCARCGQIMETGLNGVKVCGSCLAHPPAFDKTVAPFLHQAALRHLIMRLKFNADFKNARLLGQLLTEYLRHTPQMPDLIIPVPLHPSRYRKRGFNQAIEIGKTVSKCLNIPLDLSCCRRFRNTQQQTALSAKQRRNNMKQAFAVVNRISAVHVAILDDVMTTGSTVNELAGTLKTSGVCQVDVWVCARA